MRSISVFLQLIGLFVIATLGYWFWFVNWGPNPNDKVGSIAVSFLPGPVKDWGCGKLNQRFSAEAPTFCSPVAGSATQPAPTTPSAPNAPATPADPNAPANGGKL